MENVTQPTEPIHPWVYVWRVASNKTNYRRTISPDYIIEMVALYYEAKGVPITKAMIMGRSRKSLYIAARYMCWHFLYKYSTTQSLKSVGNMFNRDHSTIVNGINRLKNFCDTEQETYEDFQAIAKLLRVDKVDIRGVVYEAN